MKDLTMIVIIPGIIMSLIMFGGLVYVAFTSDSIQDDKYLIGIWDSDANNGESLVFLPDNIGYISNINDSQKLQFTWLKINVIDEKVYYEFHIFSSSFQQIIYLDKRMPSMLYYNDNIYIKRG